MIRWDFLGKTTWCFAKTSLLQIGSFRAEFQKEMACAVNHFKRFEASINNHEEGLDIMEKRMEKRKGEFAAQEKRIRKLEGELDLLKGQVTSLVATVERLQEKVFPRLTSFNEINQGDL
jgi:chromosome segregation ATPase